VFRTSIFEESEMDGFFQKSLEISSTTIDAKSKSDELKGSFSFSENPDSISITLTQ
jgi:hypothetical protein